MKCSQNDQTNQARLLEESNRNEFEIDMFREKKSWSYLLHTKRSKEVQSESFTDLSLIKTHQDSVNGTS